MGSFFSRASSAAPRTITAAPKAEAAVRAAKAAAFPPMPAVPTSAVAGAARPPLPAEMEIEANRGIVDMLNKSTILTREAPTTSSMSASERGVADETAHEGLPMKELMSMLVMHAQDPDKFTASALAKKFAVTDEVSLASALAHCKPYRVVEDPDSGRAYGVALRASEEDDQAGSDDMFEFHEEFFAAEADSADKRIAAPAGPGVESEPKQHSKQ